MSSPIDLNEPQTPRAPPSPPHSPKAQEQQDEPQTPRAPPSPPRAPKAQEQQEPRAPKAREQQEPRAPKAPKKQQATVPKEQPATVPKEPFVMYLGVNVDDGVLLPIFSLHNVEALFAKYPKLKKKDAFHITLFFFAKKCANKGEIVGMFKQLIAEHRAEVAVTVTGIGYHEGTCALQVSPTILTNDGSNTLVPWTHEKQNHITIALEDGKSAKNSVIAVMKQEESGDYPGEFIPFEPPLVIKGNLQTF